MKAFSWYFGKMPFAGKFAIRICFDALYRSTSFGERLKSYLALVGLLAVYFYGHGEQMLMGVHLMFTQNITYWAIFAGFLYAIINLVVIVVHTYLAIRATTLLLSKKYAKNALHRVNIISGVDVLLSFIVTLAGQFAFLVVYFRFY